MIYTNTYRGDYPQRLPHDVKAPDFTAVRGEDARNMTVTWTAVEDAQGYIIRWGVDPDRLHTHWQVIGDAGATIYCLTKGVVYYVTVDAYNESGVTRGTRVLRCE